MVFIKILVWVVVTICSILLMKYREKVVRVVGKNEFAERYLGPGGTYTFWILFPVFLIVIATVWLFGF